MRTLRAALVFIALTFSAAAAPAENPDAPTAAANDNRSPAGSLREGVLTIHLEARPASWYAEEAEGPGLPVYAFAEEGRQPQIPGPLIRVPEGTEVRATIRNSIPGSQLVIHGLHTRPGKAEDTVALAPGETRELRFTVGAPGTYFYWGTTSGAASVADWFSRESQLNGAFIVDPKGASADDRIFVITAWAKLQEPLADPPRFLEVLGINGRSWPHTERLKYRLGETTRWRVINASFAIHPMHLHGFYYRVESFGDSERDQIYAPDQRRLAVTQLLRPADTMAITWTAARAGNWIFHCHSLPHIAPERRFWKPAAPAVNMSHALTEHAREGMSGLVLGIEVEPAPGVKNAAARSPHRRQIELLALPLVGRFGNEPGFGFSVREGRGPAHPPAQIPGPTLVLTQGEPVSIRVRNRLPEPLAVHWHGIELEESYYDGVPGWSGSGTRLMPPIAPGASFEARFTPPRAGTFIYHSHIDDIRQVRSGLYGAIVVLQPGHKFDPEHARILVLGDGGPDVNDPPLLNGSAHPGALELHVGTRYRFRLVNITAANPPLSVVLSRAGKPVIWRAIAKDGADLPPHQATERPAQQLIAVGETYDFEFQPDRPGELKLDCSRRALILRPESEPTRQVVFRKSGSIEMTLRVVE